MPFELADLAARTAHLSVAFAGVGTIEVDYRPDLVTGDTQTIIVQFTRTGDPEPLYAELARVLIGWDVTADGQPVPTSPDGLRSVPLEVTRRTLNAIMEDSGAPKATTPAPRMTMTSLRGSSPGSRPAESSTPATSPTTTTSSPPPNGPASLPGPSPDSTTPPAVSAGVTG